MDSRKIASFIKKAVKELAEYDSALTYYLKLDNDFAIYVGWANGFDKDDDCAIHSKSQPEYCICVKVAEWNPSSIDYEWMYMPWDVETKEVWDTDTAISPNENYKLTAKWLNEDYRNMRKAYNEGKITF